MTEYERRFLDLASAPSSKCHPLEYVVAASGLLYALWALAHACRAAGWL